MILSVFMHCACPSRKTTGTIPGRVVVPLHIRSAGLAEGRLLAIVRVESRGTDGVNQAVLIVPIAAIIVPGAAMLVPALLAGAQSYYYGGP